MLRANRQSSFIIMRRKSSSSLLSSIRPFVLFTIIGFIGLSTLCLRAVFDEPEPDSIHFVMKSNHLSSKSSNSEETSFEVRDFDELFRLNWKCWSERLNLDFDSLPETMFMFRDIPFFAREVPKSSTRGIRDTAGEDLFEKHRMQREGWFPRLIYPMQNMSDTELISLYKAWNFWLVDNRGVSCQKGRSFLDSEFKPVSHSKVHIRVIAYNRENSLQRLLTSLNEADYGDEKVDLHISIDGGALGEKSLEVAQDFRWNHGQKLAIQRPENVGIVGQWVGAWDGIPHSKEDVLVVFEDDLVVSKHWFQFLKLVLQKYRTESFDSRVYGIGLEIPSIVIGETFNYRCCGRKKASLSLKDSEEVMYKYQLAGTWGTVLFPEHWSAFVQWFKEFDLDFDANPCVLNFKTNVWWENKPESIFSAWLARFAYEQGWYMLYARMPQEEGFSSSYREKGEHVNQKSGWGPSSRIVTSFNHTWLTVKLKNVQDLLVFDFHLNDVSSCSESLRYRPLLFPNYAAVRKYSRKVEYLSNRCFTASQVVQLGGHQNIRAFRGMHVSKESYFIVPNLLASDPKSMNYYVASCIKNE